MLEHISWAEKYRPKTLDDCVFPDRLYDTFAGWIEDKAIPDCLLYGPPGTGKTTVAKVCVEQIGSEWFKINGSLDGGKDNIRTDIFQFASTVAIGSEGKKYVLIDEADGVGHEAQKALRGFMDEFARNCGFIFTANYPGRILEALHSRSEKYDFRASRSERDTLMERVYKRLVLILKAEGVAFDRKVLSQIVVDRFPDTRATILEIQKIARRDGEIAAVGAGTSLDAELEALFKSLKNRDFGSLRKWSAETTLDFPSLAKGLFDRTGEYVKNESIPSLVILLGEYQHKAALVVDQEINMAAFLAQAMSEVEFK